MRRSLNPSRRIAPSRGRGDRIKPAARAAGTQAETTIKSPEAGDRCAEDVAPSGARVEVVPNISYGWRRRLYAAAAAAATYWFERGELVSLAGASTDLG